MLEGLTGVMTGRPFHGETIVHVAVVFLFVILILAAIREMKTRLAIFYLVILPIALSIFISFAIKSMFKPRIMSFTVPFISLGLATGFGMSKIAPRTTDVSCRPVRCDNFDGLDLRRWEYERCGISGTS